MSSAVSPPRSGPFRSRSLAGLGLVAALLAGGLVHLAAPAAEALPAECQPRFDGWTSKGSYTWFDEKGQEHITELGVKEKWVLGSNCDVIYNPTDIPDRDGSAPAPDVPSSPGPVVPPPPPSVPPGAGPKCVAGANNATTPGMDPEGATGTGDLVKENVEAGQKTNDLVLNMTSPSRIVSMNVNLGTPESGVPGSNPFEGMTPEQAAQSLYWPGGELPYLETGGPASEILNDIARLAIRAAQGHAGSKSAFLRNFGKYPPTTRNLVIKEVLDILDKAEAQYVATYKTLPPGAQDLVDGIFELIDLALKVPIDGPAPADLAPLYAAAAREGSSGTASGSACGQIAAAEVAPMAGLTTGSDWVTITLTGTVHGTVIDRLKALAATAPPLYCPPTTVDAVAGQEMIHNVTDECVGTVSSVRLLNRREINSLPSAQSRSLMLNTAESVDSDLVASASLASFADLDSTSWLAEGNAGFGAGRTGDLRYKAPETAGGYSDALVAAATGTDGIERPFLVKVIVRTPPVCKTDGPIHGLDPDGTHGALTGGTLEVNRGQFFLIDPKMLCSTDGRDSYRVDIAGAIPGTTREVDADGNYLYTWNDTGKVGQVGTLVVTGWDEVTGAPSAPVSLKVVVRDVAPVCKDVNLTYDAATLKGAPMTVPLDCALPDGLALLETPVARFPGTSSDDGTVFEQPEGTFRVTGSTVTFTPSAGARGSMTATDVRAWSSAPGGDLRPRESNAFAIRIELKG
ncbi:hypothetical protein [Herbiconiux solani]|uniref:hypothetical protein n=1 Tax=Herbiconiux solani TaxID=661329 RepID=UPI0012EE0904|nr:hypothetical protein [Herbiconiux solani]